MLQLQLPTTEETTIEVKVGEQVIRVDIIDIDTLHYKAGESRDKYDASGDIYEYFVHHWNERYPSAKINKYGASTLIKAKNALHDELKKKYSLSSVHDTTSASAPETKENSGSSESLNQVSEQKTNSDPLTEKAP